MNLDFRGCEPPAFDEKTAFSRMQKKMDLRKVLSVALDGEKNRGSSGVVLRNQSQGTIGYVLTNEIPSEELREKIEDILSEEGSEFYFVIDEDADRQMHIWKIPKQVVAQHVNE